MSTAGCWAVKLKNLIFGHISMKRHFSTYYFILFLLVSFYPELKSQDFLNDAAGEKIAVCTDRTTYVAGEMLFFSAVVFNTTEGAAEQFSRILYCELISPDGKKIDSRKYLLQNSSSRGCFAIPEETISGIYFLKFYTRFMRNISTEEYQYIMLKIINPFKTEVLPGKDAVDTTRPTENKMETPGVDQSLQITTLKRTYAPREEIRLTITGDKETGVPSSVCLSVIPESTYENYPFQINPTQNNTKNVAYFPETRGISLTGQVVGKESGNPLPGVKVNLSIIGDKDIMVVRTDSAGRFFFALPDYSGKKDIFLCADNIPNITPEIFIDNDFCSRPVNLPSPVFTLNEEEMKSAYKLAVNSRITSMFRQVAIATDSAEPDTIHSFYGKPSEVLVLNRYIDLPKLEEYFTEVPALAKLRKVQGKKQFRFYTTQTEMSMYDPLLLVDWVAVNDIDKILAMLPSEVERIELVNSLYIKGNVTYGGILSFVSKKNNFAGIDLPTSGTFVNYRFLEACTDSIPTGSQPINLPDSRSTVYWNPAVQLTEDGATPLSFTAPDTPGNYYILLRKISKTGVQVLSKEKIEVISE